MDPEDVINLFDSFWFNSEIFMKNSSLSPQSSNSEPNPDLKINQNSPKSNLFTHLTIHTRSKSDYIMENFSSESLSPDSVLQGILSGKEESFKEIPVTLKNKSVRRRGKNRAISHSSLKKGASKSLSELEFEELKGFMDLGFVFSEEDKNSDLVEIIPGLQRLRKTNEEREDFADEESVKDDESFISRPYLSEAWEVWDKLKKEEVNPLRDWRIPSVENEIHMKDSLKWWAHTVASSVR